MISFIVEDRNGVQQPIEIPEGISLSLMEVLKGSDYPILATCGGMALCATCRVEVLKGLEQLPEPGDEELDILDTLPFVDESSRLSCQLRVNETLEGCLFRIPKGD
ncbi:2Fe-2S iron-sulfur cluster-binding protein [Mucilaginibacter sp. AK015]|uniref:2Fe-2S iron-sulfur cluster-binding protein n=1 Tax=Mucilaginibacter sp. AK015 TaxID=2723072 RepID=UPI00161628FA|nr:2Fe-2S iron-sulfur cluster-binding protein [Mucilaginibacter sp. AK015]MBB5397246.1 2Fe-2S ferredoxin [Mucilaginibacter sp. AK015]